MKKYLSIFLAAVILMGAFQSAGLAATKTVQVKSVKITPASLTLVIGVKATLTAKISPANATNKNVTWKSANTSVVYVSSAGVVTAKAVGTAKVSVTTRDANKTDSITVTVIKPRPIPLPDSAKTIETMLYGVCFGPYLTEPNGAPSVKCRYAVYGNRMSGLPFGGLGVGRDAPSTLTTIRARYRRHAWLVYKPNAPCQCLRIDSRFEFC